MPQEAARADAASGQLLFNNACRTCHTMKEGDNRLGPNHHNIIGRKAGSLPDYGPGLTNWTSRWHHPAPKHWRSAGSQGTKQ